MREREIQLSEGALALKAGVEKKMETTTVYWGWIIGSMEKKMEATIVFKV